MSNNHEHRCPRRWENPQSDHVFPGPDLWLTDRWNAEYVWPEGLRPRSCSYCGCVHPDDAIALLEAGWEVDATGKCYKRYINPPGTGARTRALIGRMRSGRDPNDGPLPSVPNPGPPVKLYTMHMSEEQVARWNNIIDGRAER